MIAGAAEVLLLFGVVLVLFWALTPLRRRLETRIERLLARRPGRRSGRVVVLERRRDGTFGREERHDD